MLSLNCKQYKQIKSLYRSSAYLSRMTNRVICVPMMNAKNVKVRLSHEFCHFDSTQSKYVVCQNSWLARCQLSIKTTLPK